MDKINLKKRVSILKKPTCDESSPTESLTFKSKRKISFSGKKSIKEFCAGEHADTIWGTSYEESANSPSSKTNEQHANSACKDNNVESFWIQHWEKQKNCLIQQTLHRNDKRIPTYTDKFRSTLNELKPLQDNIIFDECGNIPSISKIDHNEISAEDISVKVDKRLNCSINRSEQNILVARREEEDGSSITLDVTEFGNIVKVLRNKSPRRLFKEPADIIENSYLNNTDIDMSMDKMNTTEGFLKIESIIEKSACKGIPEASLLVQKSENFKCKNLLKKDVENRNEVINIKEKILTDISGNLTNLFQNELHNNHADLNEEQNKRKTIWPNEEFNISSVNKNLKSKETIYDEEKMDETINKDKKIIEENQIKMDIEYSLGNSNKNIKSNKKRHTILFDEKIKCSDIKFATQEAEKENIFNGNNLTQMMELECESTLLKSDKKESVLFFNKNYKGKCKNINQQIILCETNPNGTQTILDDFYIDCPVTPDYDLKSSKTCETIIFDEKIEHEVAPTLTEVENCVVNSTLGFNIYIDKEATRFNTRNYLLGEIKDSEQNSKVNKENFYSIVQVLPNSKNEHLLGAQIQLDAQKIDVNIESDVEMDCEADEETEMILMEKKDGNFINSSNGDKTFRNIYKDNMLKKLADSSLGKSLTNNYSVSKGYESPSGICITSNNYKDLDDTEVMINQLDNPSKYFNEKGNVTCLSSIKNENNSTRGKEISNSLDTYMEPLYRKIDFDDKEDIRMKCNNSLFHVKTKRSEKQEYEIKNESGDFDISFATPPQIKSPKQDEEINANLEKKASKRRDTLCAVADMSIELTENLRPNKEEDHNEIERKQTLAGVENSPIILQEKGVIDFTMEHSEESFELENMQPKKSLSFLREKNVNELFTSKTENLDSSNIENIENSVDMKVVVSLTQNVKDNSMERSLKTEDFSILDNGKCFKNIHKSTPPEPPCLKRCQILSDRSEIMQNEKIEKGLKNTRQTIIFKDGNDDISEEKMRENLNSNKKLTVEKILKNVRKTIVFEGSGDDIIEDKMSKKLENPIRLNLKQEQNPEKVIENVRKTIIFEGGNDDITEDKLIENFERQTLLKLNRSERQKKFLENVRKTIIFEGGSDDIPDDMLDTKFENQNSPKLKKEFDWEQPLENVRKNIVFENSSNDIIDANEKFDGQSVLNLKKEQTMEEVLEMVRSKKALENVRKTIVFEAGCDKITEDKMSPKSESQNYSPKLREQRLKHCETILTRSKLNDLELTGINALDFSIDITENETEFEKEAALVSKFKTKVKNGECDYESVNNIINQNEFANISPHGEVKTKSNCFDYLKQKADTSETNKKFVIENLMSQDIDEEILKLTGIINNFKADMNLGDEEFLELKQANISEICSFNQKSRTNRQTINFQQQTHIKNDMEISLIKEISNAISTESNQVILEKPEGEIIKIENIGGDAKISVFSPESVKANLSFLSNLPTPTVSESLMQISPRKEIFLASSKTVGKSPRKEIILRNSPKKAIEAFKSEDVSNHQNESLSKNIHRALNFDENKIEVINNECNSHNLNKCTENKIKEIATGTDSPIKSAMHESGFKSFFREGDSFQDAIERTTLSLVENSIENSELNKTNDVPNPSAIKKKQKINANSPLTSSLNNKICTRCKNCRFSMDVTGINNFEIKCKPIKPVDFSILDKFKNLPTIIDVWIAHERRQIDKYSLNFTNIKHDKSGLSALLKDTVSNSSSDNDFQLNELLCMTEIQIQNCFPFENRFEQQLENKFSINDQWKIRVCSFFNSNSIILTHCKCLMFELIIECCPLNFENYDLKFYKIYIRQSCIYTEDSWSPKDKLIYMEISKKIPSNEILFNKFSKFNHLDECLKYLNTLVQETIEHVQELMEVIILEEADLEHYEDKVAIHKVYRYYTKEKLIAKKSIIIKIYKLNELSIRNIISPLLSEFTTFAIKELPIGIEFVKLILNNPMIYLA